MNKRVLYADASSEMMANGVILGFPRLMNGNWEKVKKIKKRKESYRDTEFSGEQAPHENIHRSSSHLFREEAIKLSVGN